MINFIDSLIARGSTPLGSALMEANLYMKNYKNPTSKIQLIILLADGNDDCGNIDSVLLNLKQSGIVFRHETIGVGVSLNAAKDLKIIAQKTGGNYHYTNNPKQLKKIFLKVLDTSEILDMLGKFDSSEENTNNSTIWNKGENMWIKLLVIFILYFSILKQVYLKKFKLICTF